MSVIQTDHQLNTLTTSTTPKHKISLMSGATIGKYAQIVTFPCVTVKQKDNKFQLPNQAYAVEYQNSTQKQKNLRKPQ